MIECHIIALNRDNYEYALDILSANVAEELLIRNDLDGMLIVGDAADSQIPIGALICRIVREEGKVKEQYRCEIRYFYVRDIYRREGLGNMLFQNSRANVAYLKRRHQNAALFADENNLIRSLMCRE